MSRSRRPPLWPLVVIFAVSGAGALTVETVWMRWLRDWMGATAPATAAATTAFFAGSSLGAWLGGRRARRVAGPAEALRAYAGVEVLAAVGAFAMPVLLGLAGGALGLVYATVGADSALLAGLRFAAALGVTLPAAVAYGATLPLIGASAIPSARTMRSHGPRLYAANVAGSAAGVAIAAWWGPPRVGVYGVYAIGIALALLAAAGAYGRSRVDESTSRDRGREPKAEAPTGALWLAAISGFVVLSVQVLLVQAFSLVVHQSVVAFGAVLITVLCCLAVASWGVAWIQSRGPAVGRTIAAWALAASAVGIASIPLALFWATSGLETVVAPRAGGSYAIGVVTTVLVVAAPALVALGCVWPATLGFASGATTDASPSGRAAVGAQLGALSAANAIGAMVGGIVTPFVVLPRLGPWAGFLAPALVCLAAAARGFKGEGRGRWIRTGGALVGLGCLLLFASPFELPYTRVPPGVDVLFERASAAGIVSVLERDGERLIRLDNHYALGGTSEKSHEERQGHLPLLLHPDPERVAFVGSATGITAGAALAHDVDEVTLVEIVPDVVEAGRDHFGDANRGVYVDPRGRTVVDDARNYFRHTRDVFDVIVADLFVPWQAGTGALYSREHFAAMRDRLRSGGLVAQWLPLYQLSADEFEIVAATFSDVFPTAALFRGDFYGDYPIVALVGWRDEVASLDTVEGNARALGRRGVEDRWVTHPEALWSFYVSPLAPWVRQAAPRNTLASPQIEFLAAARHAGGRRGKMDPLVRLAWTRRVAAIVSSIPSSSDPLYPDLPPQADRARRGGLAFQQASALYAAGRRDDAARALAAAADLLPGSVLADGAPDSSVADVWP